MKAWEEAQDNFLQYAVDYSWGLLAAVISDPIVTSLFLGAFSPWKSVRRFYLGYAASRTINSVANAIGTGGLALARAVENGRLTR